MRKNKKDRARVSGILIWVFLFLGLTVSPGLAAVKSISDVEMDEDTVKQVIYQVTSGYSVVTQEISWAETTLFPADSITLVNKTITLSPATNQYDESNMTITLRTATNSVASSSGWDEETFRVKVMPVDDAASFSNISNIGRIDCTNAAVKLFNSIQINDDDNDTAERYSVEISITSGEDFGTLDNYVPQTNVTATTLIAALKKVTYTPLPYGMTGQQNNFTYAVKLTDPNDETSGSVVVPYSLTGYVNRVNIPPTASLTVSPDLLNDTASGNLFSGEIFDFEEDAFGSNVTVQLTCSSDASGEFGSLSTTNAYTGTCNAAIAYLRGITYTPIANQILSNTQTITFQISVTDDDGAVVTKTKNLTLKEVPNNPLIGNVSTAMAYVEDTESVKPFPTIDVSELDRKGNQLVTLELSVSPEGMGVFSPAPSSALMTPAAAQSYLRNVSFVPDSGSLAVGETQIAILTVKVTDDSDLVAENSNARVSVTGVNGPPEFEGGFGAHKVISPGAMLPFKGLWVSDDDGATAIISGLIIIDDGAKGTLGGTTLAGFKPESSTTYSFSGSIAEVSNMFSLIEYDVSETYAFAAGAYGKAMFELQAEDVQGNRVFKELEVSVAESARAICVTREDDGMSPGMFRHAISIASAGDVIVFDFDEYPAIIRLNHALGKVVIDKHLDIRGPGAKNLTISGNSDGAQEPETQILEVSATVTIDGVRFEGGTAEMGGAIIALENSRLFLRNCEFEHCIANQYGGAVNVDYGDLYVENCLFRHNSTSDSGIGGGAISVYSSGEVELINSTFSANTNGASANTGGGAVYLQNSDGRYFFDTKITHCTFHENVDNARVASAVYAQGQSTRITMKNSLFADQQFRNIYGEAAATFFSDGGNICDDSTFAPFGSSVDPDSVFYLYHSTDITNAELLLGPLASNNAQVETHALPADSVAIDAGVYAGIGTDQRQRFRDASPDCGAYEYDAKSKIIVNEIQQGGSPSFIEFYVPRDARTVHLQGYILSVDGVDVHTFGEKTIAPGFGFAVASGSISVPAGCQLIVAASLRLGVDGLIQIRDAEGQLLVSQDYCTQFVDVNEPSGLINLGSDSLTLSPQFSGANFLPHSWVGSSAQSLGADTDLTDFGADNARPVANPDLFVVSEDRLTTLDVLENDSDADGTDRVYVSSLFTSESQRGSACQIGTDPLTEYGIFVSYDPRTNSALQKLTAEDKMYDYVRYVVEDRAEGLIESLEEFQGGDVRITSENHRLSNGQSVSLLSANTKIDYVIKSVTPDTFVIEASLAALNDFDHWVGGLRGGTNSAMVALEVIGVNDCPEAAQDELSTDEEDILTIMTETDILPNDQDVDMDDDWSSLKVVGVMDSVSNIEAIYGEPSDTQVQVRSVDHGLADGDTIVISGYDGYDGYNGLHTISVVDSNTFTLAVQYVDAVTSGVWGHLNDENRLTATSSMGAAVSLDIRFNKEETSITYNPLVSTNINALSLAEIATDEFYYVLGDSHGALSIGRVLVELTGENESPTVTQDPQGVDVLDPYIGEEQTLRSVLDGVRVLDSIGSEGRPGRVDVRVLPEGEDVVNSAVLKNVWEVMENQYYAIPFQEILANDFDEDVNGVNADDVLTISDAFVSSLGVTSEVYAVGDLGVLETEISTKLETKYVAEITRTVKKGFELEATAAVHPALEDDLKGVFGGSVSDRADLLFNRYAVGITLPENFRSMLEGELSKAYHNRFAGDLVDLLVAGMVADKVTEQVVLAKGRAMLESSEIVNNIRGQLEVGTVGVIIYNAADSGTFDALAHKECLMDTFEAVVSDQKGGFATNLVSVMVRGVNDTPIAFNDYPHTYEDVAFSFNPVTYSNYLNNHQDYDVDQNGRNPDNTLWVLETNGVTSANGLFSVSDKVFQFDPSDSLYFDGIASNRFVYDHVRYTLTDQSFIFANDDLFRVESGGESYTLSVMANDALYNERGGSLRIVDVGVPDHFGSVVTNAAGTALIYTPDRDFRGDEVFTYAIGDEFGNYCQARLTVRVTEETFNGHIQVNNDRFTVSAGEQAVLPVLLNDDTLPATGEEFEITSIEMVDGNDQVTINGRNLIFEQTDTDRAYPYTAHIMYNVTAEGSASAQGHVWVEVVNRSSLLPVNADHYRVSANSSENILDVLANDLIQPEPVSFTLLGVVIEGNGTVTLDAENNWFVYTPKAKFVGEDIFTYLAEDELGGTGFGTVTVRVGDPVVSDDVFSVPADAVGTVVLDVLQNDYQLLNPVNSMRVTSVTPIGNSLIGSVAVNAANTALTFDPNGTVGSAAFTYVLADAAGYSLTGQLTLSTESENDVYANADRYYVSAGAQNVEIDVLCNDLLIASSTNRALTVFSVNNNADAPNHGGTVVVAGDNKSLVYTPAAGYAGEETFTYTVTDGYSYNEARVTMVVKEATMAIAEDVFAVYHDGENAVEFTLPVLANDRFLPQGSGVMAVVGIGAQPNMGGSVQVSSSGDSILYSPNTNYTGEVGYLETFTYEVSDGSARRAQGSVEVRVMMRHGDRDLSRETNDDCFSVVRNSTVNELRVLGNDGARPASATSWEITSVTTPEYGGEVAISDANIIYTPARDFIGTDIFEYSIWDKMGGTATATVKVKVGDLMLNEDHFTVISGTESNLFNVLVNDGIMPVQEYERIIHKAFDSEKGAVLDVVSNTVCYTPNAAYAGDFPYVDHFLYTLNDDSNLSVTQNVSVTIIEKNDDRDWATVQVAVHGVNDLPLLDGFSERMETYDNISVNPYRNVNVRDVDEWGSELQTTTVEYEVSKGSVSNLSSFVQTTPGLLTLTATPANTTKALRGLVFVPFGNRIGGGKNEPAYFTHTLRDPFMTTAFTNQLELLVWAANDAPILSGIIGAQQTQSAAPKRIFETVHVADVDEYGMQSLRAEVILATSVVGTLGNLGDFEQKSPTRWEMTGMPSELIASLRGLEFGADLAWLQAGGDASLGIQLLVHDGFSPVPANAMIDLRVGPLEGYTDWIRNNFGSSESMMEDDDHDGRSNLQEYAFGTESNEGQDPSNITVKVEPGQIVIAYTRRANDPVLIYELWSSADLVNWGEVRDFESTTRVEPLAGGFERCIETLPTDESTHYFNVRVFLNFEK